MKSSKKQINFDNGNRSLVVEGLFKRYGKNPNYAVENLSFLCESGQIVGLLGENGAGKSTALKCITGMIAPTDGKIEICGYDISKQPIEAKHNFSFVTDNHSVFTKLTGMQYLNFMADVYGVEQEKRTAAYEKLEQVFRLGDSVNSLISSYSHGMKQKICMIGSLLHEPSVWILDEPMLGLDPPTQKAVTEFMESYAKSGRIILFSSHNLDVVRRICDRIIIIKKGKLEHDTLCDDNVKNNPSVLEDYYFRQQEEVAEEKC